MNDSDSTTNTPPEPSIDIITFIKLLNESVRGVKTSDTDEYSIILSSPDKRAGILNLYYMLEEISKITDKHDPEQHKDCRFGNKAFNSWLNEVTSMCDVLFDKYRISSLCNSDLACLENLKSRFLSSFGNHKRIDYGTGMF